MSYLNRPYENSYYEEKEVIRESPYGGYSAEYRINEYGNRVPHHHHQQQQHHNGVGEVVREIVGDVLSGGHHHNHGRPTEYIERREERIVDSSYDPYRRNY